MRVQLVKPISFCEGVNNAITLALKTKKDNPNKNIYIFGQLVHNSFVEKFLEGNGIRTLERDEKTLLSITDNSIVILTAHGHSHKIEEILNKNKITYVDATCKKVAHTYDLVLENSKTRQVIYIGINGHPETEGIIHENTNIILYDVNKKFDYSLIKEKNPFVINQTTLNYISLRNIHSEIKHYFPDAEFFDEICPTTRLRQENISKISNDVSLIVIIGDENSSNTKRLYENAINFYPKKKILLVNSLEAIKKYDLKSYKNAAIASGASTPMDVINSIKNYLENIN